jgi:transcriptional regulator with XRE-family HTH domain
MFNASEFMAGAATGVNRTPVLAGTSTVYPPLTAAFLTAFVMFSGTGGVPVANECYFRATSPSLQAANYKKSGSKSVIAALSGRLARIQAALGLSITELAKVFQVQRPAIYSWINEKSEPHPSNNEKINRIYELSNKWAKMCSISPAKYLHARTSAGHTLLEILEKNADNDPLIHQVFDELKATVELAQSNRRTSVSELLEQKGVAKIPDYYSRELFRRPS